MIKPSFFAFSATLSHTCTDFIWHPLFALTFSVALSFALAFSVILSVATGSNDEKNMEYLKVTLKKEQAHRNRA